MTAITGSAVVLTGAGFLAANGLLNDAIDSANKAGNLGMQGLLLLLLGVSVYLIVHGQKDAKVDREKRFDELRVQNAALLAHHETVAKQYATERAEIAQEREDKFLTVLNLQKETNAALGSNTAAIQAVGKSMDAIAHVMSQLKHG